MFRILFTWCTVLQLDLGNSFHSKGCEVVEDDEDKEETGIVWDPSQHQPFWFPENGKEWGGSVARYSAQTS